MKVYILAFYFFCWITVRIDVSLTAQKGDPLKEDDNAVSSSKTVVEESTGDNANETPDVCKFLESLDVLQLNDNDETYSSLGPLQKVAQIFDAAMSLCPIYVKKSQNIWNTQIENLVEPLNRIVGTRWMHFNQTINDIEGKLMQTLPKFTLPETTALLNQFVEYRKLNWSYENSNIVEQADEITNTLSWLAEKIPDDRVLNPKMYHVLNEKLKDLKEQLFTSNKVMSVAKELQDIILETHVSFLDEDFSDVRQITNSTFFKAANDIFRCQRLLNKVSSFKELNREILKFNDAILKATQWLNNINRTISKEVEMLNRNLQSVADESDADLLQKLAAQYYINVETKHKQLMKHIGKSSHIFYTVTENLESLYMIKYYKKWFFYDMQKVICATLGISVKPQDTFPSLQKSEKMKHNGVHYNAIVKNIHTIKFLKNYKSYAETIIKIFKDVKEAVTGDACVLSDATVDKTQTLQHIKEQLLGPLNHIDELYKTVYLNMELNNIFKKNVKYNSLIRMLQYFWGTGNSLSKKLVTDKTYKSDKEKRQNTLKNIGLALCNSIIALEIDFNEDDK